MRSRLTDSAFEYLPKTHLLNHRISDQYIHMYRLSLASFSKNLFFRPSLPGDPDILVGVGGETPFLFWTVS
jgi:mannosyl-oligosaccharide alpha-1,2-mannosidase